MIRDLKFQLQVKILNNQKLVAKVKSNIIAYKKIEVLYVKYETIYFGNETREFTIDYIDIRCRDVVKV